MLSSKASAAAGAVLAAVLFAPIAEASGPNWDALAQCESSGNWVTNTGNGFYGGIQFTASTWRAYGGTQFAARADLATREQQIATGQRVLAGQGPGAWPACSRKTGWHNGSGASTAPRTAPKVTRKAPAPHRATAPAVPRAAVVPASATRTYTVQPGDTLSGIAQRFGVRAGWPAVFSRNHDQIADPDLIYPGQSLALP